MSPTTTPSRPATTLALSYRIDGADPPGWFSYDPDPANSDSYAARSLVLPIILGGPDGPYSAAIPVRELTSTEVWGLLREPPDDRAEPHQGSPGAIGLPQGAPDACRGRRSWAFWTAVADQAIACLHAGQVLPELTGDGRLRWRAGRFDVETWQYLSELAQAMPARARSTPAPSAAVGPETLPDLSPAWSVLRGGLDDLVDAAVRTVAEPPPPGSVDLLRDWVRSVAARCSTPDHLVVRIETAAADAADGSDAAPVLRAEVALRTEAGEVVSAASIWAGTEPLDRERMNTILATLHRLEPLWTPFAGLLAQDVPERVDLGDDEVTALLRGGAQAIAAEGVELLWPATVRRDLTTQLNLHDTESGSGHPTRGGGSAVAAEWEFALGATALRPAELAELTGAARPLVRLRDQWVLHDPVRVAETLRRPAAAVPSAQALALALSGRAVDPEGNSVGVRAGGRIAELRDRLRASTDPEPATVPADLQADLRDYQRAGFGWLARMTDLGFGVCLADDMGLGKTLQLIALHLHRTQSASPDSTDPPSTSGPGGPGGTLVICPASLLGNWQRELERFAPGVPVSRFHGTERRLPTDVGVVLSTYAIARRDQHLLAGRQWDLLVLDEAQHVKNPRSQAARAVRAIRSSARVALTGTPVENSLLDLWSILDWANPGLLGTRTQFLRRWADPIGDGNLQAAQALSRLTQPFLLRRRKSDPRIAPELPLKTYTDHVVDLTPEQVGLYTAAVEQAMSTLAAGDGSSRMGQVVSLITACKQICNHPAQYLGQPRARLAGRSGKLELLDELLDTIAAEQGAALVFTQYVVMARLLERHLAGRGVATLLLHGGTSVEQREAMVARFQDPDLPAPVFLLSLKAAGTGLNLTRADHVIHVDHWWNPAVEDQASDRAHRIGQTKPVQVHRLLTRGTIEEKVQQVLAGKRDLADAVMHGAESGLTRLSDADLAGLLRLGELR